MMVCLKRLQGSACTLSNNFTAEQWTSLLDEMVQMYAELFTYDCESFRDVVAVDMYKTGFPRQQALHGSMNGLIKNKT